MTDDQNLPQPTPTTPVAVDWPDKASPPPTDRFELMDSGPIDIGYSDQGIHVTHGWATHADIASSYEFLALPTDTPPEWPKWLQALGFPQQPKEPT